jgi:UPF0755 protein
MNPTPTNSIPPTNPPSNPAPNKAPSQPASPTVPKKDPKPKRLWLKILLWSLAGLFVVIVALSLWFVMGLSAVRADVPVDGEIINIQNGSSIETVANDLSSKNLIGDKNVFILWAKFGPSQGLLQPGPYLIKPTSTIAQIVADMAAGRVTMYKITYPEGITVNEMAKRWSSAGYGSKDDYLAATKKLSFDFDFIPQISKTNPEGYLFPATYTFAPGSSAEVVVRKQYEAFRVQVEPLLSGSRPGNLSKQQVLTLASIVEKEALTTADRKLVAGVFLNRLSQDMRLESDVTVNYATGKTVTTPGDLSVNSPYNTYRVRGLPPTPINNPGTDSIEAVLSATPSEYLFFLAGKDGKVYYAKTLEEHNQNIKNHLN